MANNVKFKSPALPIPPAQYNQSLYQRTFSILRLYFNQLDEHLRQDLGDTTINGDLTVTGGVTATTLTGTLQTAAQTNITSVGALNGGSITSGFGNIDIGTSTIDSGVVNATGPVTITSSDTNADLVISNSEASSAEASPIIELWRQHGSSGGNDGDEIGEIQFYGMNDRTLSSGGPQKVQYATIYGEIVDSTAGTEDGSIKFGIANNGSIEDPILSVFNYGIAMGTDNDLRLGLRGEIWFEGASGNTNETVLFCVDPTQENTVLLPDDSGTLSLDGENQTSYRTGEVIEVITGYADGSTISGQATSAGAARDFALEDVTAFQSLTTSYGKINGTLVTYLPPVGTKTLEIEYGIFVGYQSPDTGIMHHKLSVGGTYVTNTRMTHRDDSALNKYVILKSILTVDGSGDVAAGNVDDWNSAIALQLDAREYGASSEIKLHLTTYYDGSSSSGTQIVVPPSVRITAIG